MKERANHTEIYNFSKRKNVLHFLAEESYSVLIFDDHSSVYFGVGLDDQNFFYCYDTIEELTLQAAVLPESFEEMFRKTHFHHTNPAVTPGL